MPDIQFIRQLREREGWSLRRIAREFHFSRKTVTKYLQRTDTTETPQYVRRNPAPAPQMDPYRAVIESWLRQDAEMPRKQRHTSRRIWQRLRDEYGATAAESTVRHYVARMRRELQPAAQPVFLDLVFDPAEAAQVDWGEVQVILDGQSVTAQMFCMRLAYSGACYVQLFPHQRLEAFLAAHVAAFEFFGFVPQRIIYDNLTTAVQRVLHGRARELNPRFQELTAHYVYEAVFATPAAGWEKGLVEGLVGYVRRTYCVPLPTGPDWDTLNAALKTACLAERVRTLPRRHDTTIGELWDHERTADASLPGRAFRPVTWWPVRATSQAIVRHRRVPYSVPASRVGQKLRLAAYGDPVEIGDAQTCVATHPLGVAGQPQLQLDHYRDVLRVKPGAVRNARVVRDLGPLLRAYQDAFFHTNPSAYGAFVEILFLFRRFPAEHMLAILPAAQADRCFTVEALTEYLTQHRPAARESDSPTPGPTVVQPAPALYEELLMEVSL